MHVEVYRLKFADYQFSIELDTGASIGEQQLTAYYRVRKEHETLPLTVFSLDILLKALQEPYKTILYAQLEEAKEMQRQIFEAEIASAQSTGIENSAQQARAAHAYIKQLRRQLNRTLQQLEQQFIEQELVPLGHSRFDPQILQHSHKQYAEWHMLRDFYFEETNYNHVANFCQEFAEKEDFRAEVLAGARHWYTRNLLFERNIQSVIIEQSVFNDDYQNYIDEARGFFHWLDMHVESIVALPAYRELQARDSAFTPSAQEIDPLIRETVARFNSIPGVVTRFSCQGVSGKVFYQGYQIMAATPHEEYAYLSFAQLSPCAHDALIDLLPTYPTITLKRSPWSFASDGMRLRSTGENERFRAELSELAERLTERIRSVGVPDNEEMQLTQWCHYHYPERLAPIATPGGIIASRLQWLCRPERIEQTLTMLHHLDYWLQQRETRSQEYTEKLTQVKIAIIEQAYQRGTLKPGAYIDGTACFAHEFHIVDASYFAAEQFCKWLANEDEIAPAMQRTYQDLFARITGYPYSEREAYGPLAQEKVESCITSSILKLIKEAQQARRPIAGSELAALLVTPAHLLNLSEGPDRSAWDRRAWHYADPDWDELTEQDRKQLDPEGGSVVAFRYQGQSVQYTFHLPLRSAESFLKPGCLRELRYRKVSSQEQSLREGQPIPPEESQRYPLNEILYDLCCNIHLIKVAAMERRGDRCGSTVRNKFLTVQFEVSGVMKDGNGEVRG